MLMTAPSRTDRILSYEERFFGIQPQTVNQLTFEAPVTVNIAPPQTMAVALIGLLTAALPLIPLVLKK
jgi:hypothetical protein